MYHRRNGQGYIYLKEQFTQSVDYGIDFYAMQTLKAPDGRRIMIGWMQNWDTLAYRCNDSGWFAQMSLPRELSVKKRKIVSGSDQRNLNAIACKQKSSITNVCDKKIPGSHWIRLKDER